MKTSLICLMLAGLIGSGVAAAQTSATGSAPAPSGAPAAAAPAATPSKPSTSSKTDPTGAIAKCKDGTYSHAKKHSGACSHHGGVASFLDGK